MKKGFLLGGLVTLAVLALVGYVGVIRGWMPARGDDPPGALEKWAARASLRATIRREATETCPLQPDEANLMAGAKLYGPNCACCHGTPTSPTPAIATGLNPDPPLFGKDPKEWVTDDPEAKIYWKINHGIKFTGMPSYNKALDATQMWQLTLFLKHMDKLPPAVEAAWKSLS